MVQISYSIDIQETTLQMYSFAANLCASLKLKRQRCLLVVVVAADSE